MVTASARRGLDEWGRRDHRGSEDRRGDDEGVPRTARIEGPKRRGSITTMPTAAKGNDHRSISDQSGQATAPIMHRENTRKAAHASALLTSECYFLDVPRMAGTGTRTCRHPGSQAFADGSLLSTVSTPEVAPGWRGPSSHSRGTIDACMTVEVSPAEVTVHLPATASMECWSSRSRSCWLSGEATEAGKGKGATDRRAP